MNGRLRAGRIDPLGWLGARCHGVDTDGRHDVLDGSVSRPEAEVHGRAFLSEFKDRGLYGMERMVSEEALPESFTVFSLPPSHRRRLRTTPRLSSGTTHLVERLNE